jgi:hypothetical protein
VSTFKTKAAFTQYVKLRGEAGNMLQWSHMVLLAQVGDEATRMQLAATALERCWSVEDLTAKVREMVNKTKRGSGRSAKTKIPSSVRAALTHMQSQASKFVQNVDNAWTGDAYDLTKEIDEIPADRLTDQFLEGVQETKERVTDMRERATDLEKVLTAAAKKLAKRIEKQKAAEAAAQAEEAEEAEEELDVAEAEGAELVEAATETDESGDEYVDIGKLERLKSRQEAARKRNRRRKHGTKRAGRVGVNR